MMSFLHKQLSHKLFPATAALLSLFGTPLAAGTLDIAKNALEISTGVDPNILILADDSLSMDLGIITSEAGLSMHLPDTSSDFANRYYYTHPSTSTDTAPAKNAAAFGTNTRIMPDPEFMATQGLADDGGAWRAWNSDYNKIYYNPNVEYTPWKGVNTAGATYANMSETVALYDPFEPSHGSLNLTTTLSYTAKCTLPACTTIPALTGNFTVTDFYPARYYTWTDSNTDGIVDASDAHTLVEIKSANFPKDRAGTRTDCGGDGEASSTISCSYAQEIQNFANWFSYYRKRDLTAKNAYSKVIEPVTGARVGFITINKANPIQVAPMNVSINSGNKRTLMDEIFEVQPIITSTPLRESLRDAGRYFECVADNIYGLTAASPAENPTNRATANNCPVFAAPAGTCQQHYTIQLSDGEWNGSSPSVGNTDEDDGTADFDGGSFADTASDTLADVAMHYYERDLHGLTDSVPTTARDRNLYRGATNPFRTMHQHMATYTVGLGVSGTLTAGPTDKNTAFTWPDPTAGAAEKIDDLRHAAWNGRGDFLSASDSVALTSSLEDIFSEISAGTGAASSVAFNTQNLESGALIFRAFFDTTTNTGSLVAQDVSITGAISPTLRWDAAERLDDKTGASSDSREIVTYNATSLAGIPFQWTDLDATQKTQLETPVVGTGTAGERGEARLNYLRGQSEKEASNNPASNEDFRDRPSAGGKLGDIVHSTPVFVGEPPFRGRDQGLFPTHAPAIPIVTTDLYSTFETMYRNRREIVYIGANDGMLHGFDANTGEEVMAYVPNVGFDQLTKLTDPNYTHQYFVDLSPAVNDIFADLMDGDGKKWHTVLVGGRGAGGPGLFALDVTDPTTLDTEAEAKDKVLWEFTQADDINIDTSLIADNSNLGTLISEPLIAMTNVSDGGSPSRQRWAAIFGNGYNSASTNGNAELFIVFLDGGVNGSWTHGTDYIKINTGKGKVDSADGTTPNSLGGVRGIDTDNNGTVDVVYAGDLQGNVYRFDLSGNTIGSWDLPSGNPLFTATYKSGGPIQPITNRPIVIKHPSAAGYLVIVGTGSYFTTDDITDTSIQSIYGLWDDLGSTINPVDYARLVEQSFTNQATAISGFTVRTLSNITIDDWAHNGSGKKEGWVIDLDVPPAGGVDGDPAEFPGERAVRNFILRGGLLFVNTVIPKSQSACTTGAGGFELGFNPANGGSGTNIIFDVNNISGFDDNDNVGGSATAMDGSNVVTGIRFDDSTPTDSSFIGNRKVTQTSDKSIRSIATNTGNDNAIGRNSWRELE
ncbi:pilus assembly protein [Sulfuriflexus mobilis]|uniref:pilus assembly protein n=1 Tax=Sulfuriflexus mobilis TaxID=1811807 RepID=UPI000F8301E1|nr:PilC/PilY family type IV pilus protein [Sulfuriflexus mobilis]